jgi:gamma-F420-2:alpha-L-glutamate ligase
VGRSLKKTFWVVYDNEQYVHNRWFADRLVSVLGKDFDARLVIAEKLSCGIIGGEHVFFCGDTPVERPDAAVMRAIFPFLSELLESLGTRVFNPAEFSRIANDKRLSYAAAASAGLKTADTFYIDRRFSKFNAGNFTPGAASGFGESTSGAAFDSAFLAGRLGSPFVLKTAAGHGGKGVDLVFGDRKSTGDGRNAGDGENGKSGGAESSCDMAGIMSKAGFETGFAAQRIIGNAEGDVRVYVLGGRIVAAAMRTSNGGFKSNVSLGGNAQAYTLASREKELVERLYASLKAKPDFAGFDVIPAEGEFIFNEMEDVVGTRMLYGVYGIDAAGSYCDYMASVMSDRFRENGHDLR